MEDNKVPEYLLEKFLLGELSKTQVKQLQNRVSPSELIAMADKLSEKNMEFFKEEDIKYDIAKIKQKYLMEKNKETKNVSNWHLPKMLKFAAVPTLALILFAIFVVVNNNDITDNYIDDNIIVKNNNIEDTIRLKGDPYLVFYKNTDEQNNILTEKSVVKEGEEIQILCKKYNDNYGIIFSIDGSGALTLLYPDTENSNPYLGDKSDKLLDFAYKFDNAPYYEKFYFISSMSDFNVKNLLNIVRKTIKNYSISKNKLPLPKNYHQFSITFIKGK